MNENLPVTQNTQNYSLLPSKVEREEMQIWASVLQKTPYYVKLGGIEGILAIMLTARELQIPSGVALNGGIYNVQGRLCMSSDLKHQRLLAFGHKIKVLHIDENSCILLGTRGDNKEKLEIKYTIQQAQRSALLGKDVWKKYPESMLFKRAVSRLVDFLMPEVTGPFHSSAESEIMEADIEFTEKEAEKAEEAEHTEVHVPSEEARIDPKATTCYQPTTDEALVMEFVDKYKLNSPTSEMGQYVTTIAGKAKTSRKNIIESAAKNPDGFVQAFEKQKEKKEEARIASEIETPAEAELLPV